MPVALANRPEEVKDAAQPTPPSAPLPRGDSFSFPSLEGWPARVGVGWTEWMTYGFFLMVAPDRLRITSETRLVSLVSPMVSACLN